MAIYGLVPLALILFTAAPSHAESVTIQLVTRVPEGQQPRIKLLAVEPVEAISVELARDDGRNVSTAFGATPRGTTREVRLDGAPGNHRYTGQLRITRDRNTASSDLSFETVVAPQLKVDLDKSRVDLPARRLELRLSRPPGKVSVKALGESAGAPLAEVEHDFTGHAAGETLVVTWPSTGADIARIDLKVSDVDGFFVTLSLFPWSVSIPHEEIAFATDSAVVTPSEKPKLDASFRLIAEALTRHHNLGPIRLFIAGHTDTQGAAAYNLALSQRRAAAIATWFRRRGLRLPIAHEGFGEHAPLVATPDETDEPRNRRVDYILAIEPPILRATAFHANWKAVP